MDGRRAHRLSILREGIPRSASRRKERPNPCRGNLRVTFHRGRFGMPHPPRVSDTGIFIVAGRVVRVRARPGGGWRVRLTETGGALAAAEIRSSNPIPLPPAGAYILVRGTVAHDPVHDWYIVDPVVSWVEVTPMCIAATSGVLASSHDRGWLGLAALRT